MYLRKSSLSVSPLPTVRLLKLLNNTSKKANTCYSLIQSWYETIGLFLCPIQQRTGTLTETVQHARLSAKHLVSPLAKNATSLLYIIITSFHNPIVCLHHSVLFHHVVSIAQLAAGLYTQTLADRKATLTPITFKFSSV